MHKNRHLIVKCILRVVALKLFTGSAAFSQTAGQANLIERAKKEGQLLWYVSLVVGGANALQNRFNQKYPLIKTKLLRAGSELLNRILKEQAQVIPMSQNSCPDTAESLAKSIRNDSDHLLDKGGVKCRT